MSNKQFKIFTQPSGSRKRILKGSILALALILTLSLILPSTTPNLAEASVPVPHPVPNGGFEDGLTGWTTYGTVSVFDKTGQTGDAAFSVINNPAWGGAPPKTWKIAPNNGNKMVLIRPSGNPGVNKIVTDLRLSQASKDYITNVYKAITNVGYIYQDVTLTEGQTFSISWHYVA